MSKYKEKFETEVDDVEEIEVVAVKVAAPIPDPVIQQVKGKNELAFAAISSKLDELIALTSDSAELVLSANKLGLDVYAIQTMNKHFIKAKTFSEAVEAIAKRLDT